ncbi:MAG: hypothetical protein LBC41_02450 [Clostridiales bacterium]|jgi:hypothetical protein|nr:hypothetical protein [Clostridiales bacterium]MDR2749497.1 hypothetical protein [Clostridiales bacterium]
MRGMLAPLLCALLIALAACGGGDKNIVVPSSSPNAITADSPVTTDSNATDNPVAPDPASADSSSNEQDALSAERWFGTYVDKNNSRLTISAFESPKSFQFEIMSNNRLVLSTFLEMTDSHTAKDAFFQFSFTELEEGDSLELVILTEFGEGLAGTYIKDDSGKVSFTFNFGLFETKDMPALSVNSIYYLDGNPNNPWIRFTDIGVLSAFIDNTDLFGKYEIDGKTITISGDAAIPDRLSSVNISYLSDSTGRVYAFKNVDSTEIATNTKYYQNADPDSAYLIFYDDGNAEIKTPYTDKIYYSFTASENYVSLTDVDVSFTIINTYLIEYDGYIFVRKP